MDFESLVLQFFAQIGLISQGFLLDEYNEPYSGHTAFVLCPFALILLCLLACLPSLFYAGPFCVEFAKPVLSLYTDTVNTKAEQAHLRKSLSLVNLQHIATNRNLTFCTCAHCNLQMVLFCIMFFFNLGLLCTMPFIFPIRLDVYQVWLHLMAFHATVVWLNSLCDNALAVVVIAKMRKFAWIDKILFPENPVVPLEIEEPSSPKEMWGLTTDENMPENACGSPNFINSPAGFCPLWKYCAGCTRKREFLFKNSLIHAKCLLCADLKACRVFDEVKFLALWTSCDPKKRATFECDSQISDGTNKQQ